MKAIAALLVSLCLLGLGGCAANSTTSATAASAPGSTASTTPATAPATSGPTTSTPINGGYSAAVEQEFILNCEASHTAETACRCVFDRFKTEVPYNRYLELQAMARSGGDITKTEIKQILDRCGANPQTTASTG